MIKVVELPMINSRQIKCLLSVVLSVVVSAMLVLSPYAVADAVPVKVGPIYYQLGGGKVVGNPVSGWKTIKITARYSAGFGYSCGQFNPHETVTQMINQIQSKVRELPNQLEAAFTAALISLPGYLLKREYPGLYGVITKTLDDSFDLFSLSVKSCKQIESEMNTMGADHNPYQNLLQASVAERWEYEVGFGGDQTVDQIKNAVGTEVGKRGVKWLEGVSYGGLDQAPIRFNHDLVVAGYNTLIGRSPTNDETEPAIAYRDNHIYSIWQTPALAAKWLVDIVGEEEIKTDNSTPKVIAPMGMRPFLRDTTVQLQAALRNAVNANAWGDIRTYDSMGIAIAVVESIRKEEPYLRGAMIAQVAGEMAIIELLERVQLIERLLNAGLKQADVTASKASSTAATYVKNDTLPKLNKELKDILETHQFRNGTLHKTALTILNRGAMQDLKAIGAAPPSTINPNTIRDTGVPAL